MEFLKDLGKEAISSVIKGTGGVVVVFVAAYFWVNPISNKVDKVVDVLNREVIPRVNLLVPQNIPPIQQIDKLSKKLEELDKKMVNLASAVNTTNSSLAAVSDLRTAVATLTKSVEDQKKIALAAAVGPVWLAGKEFVKGQEIPVSVPTATGIEYTNAIVQDPDTFNKLSATIRKDYAKHVGIKVLAESLKKP